MMNSSGPNQTTALGGLGLALVALIPLVALLANWLPNSDESFLLLRSAPTQVTVDLILLASCVILSFGFRGERDIVGSSALGRVGFLLLGLASLIQALLSFLIGGLNLAGSPAAIWMGTALELLPMAATAVAAVAVIRARVLAGFARWILLGVAASEMVQFALSFALSTSQSVLQDYGIAVLFFLAAVPLLLLLSAGVSFALVGRSARIAQRLHTIHATWRATT